MALGQFSPGPDMVLLTRTALASGRTAGCWTAVGIACGLAMHAAIAVTGISVLYSRGGELVIVMKYAAALYLTWLAYQLIRSGLRSSPLLAGHSRGEGESVYLSWKRGFFCNLLNPKVAVFLAGVTAPFLAIQKSPDHWSLILWATIVFEGVILWCVWVFVLQIPMIRERYLRVAHWFDLAFGVILLGLALMLILV
ncbi:MAG: LysE family transporter [Akkermansiaceae bacterium]|nr:LysE family transporter [Akkermansiaceae bacterium]